MDFKIDLPTKFIEVNIGGTAHKLRVPKVHEAEDYNQRLADAKSPKEVAEAMRKFLGDIGLPKDVMDELDHVSFLELVQFVGNPKKN